MSGPREPRQIADRLNRVVAKYLVGVLVDDVEIQNLLVGVSEHPHFVKRVGPVPVARTGEKIVILRGALIIDIAFVDSGPQRHRLIRIVSWAVRATTRYACPRFDCSRARVRAHIVVTANFPRWVMCGETALEGGHSTGFGQVAAQLGAQ